MTASTMRTILVAVCVSIALGACISSNPEWFQPTGRAASVPGQPEPEFTQYVHDSRENIRQILDDLRFKSGQSPYLGGYTSEEAARMRGPFQLPEKDSDLCWDPSKGGGKGFLLIHGLTDSPYLMRSISDSLQKAYPCALIRAVLLPGHGTVVGDSLKMKHEDWMRMTDYGVRSFQKIDQIHDLYLVGFSTGTALAIKYMKEGQSTNKIKGLVLVSTAVKAKTKLAWATTVLRFVKDWASKYEERDAARYESFSMNAGAEFYELTKDLGDSKYALKVPVLMAVSADDDTIDAAEARKFFCDLTTANRRALIWYKTKYTQEDPALVSCNDIATVEFESPDLNYKGTPYRFANFAHIALTMSPGDKHYGVNGKYRNCKSYEEKGDVDGYAKCRQGSEQTIFSENNIATLKDENGKKLQYDYWRRGTFNPDYDRLEKSILCFTNDECQLESVLNLSR